MSFFWEEFVGWSQLTHIFTCIQSFKQSILLAYKECALHTFSLSLSLSLSLKLPWLGHHHYQLTHACMHAEDFTATENTHQWINHGLCVELRWWFWVIELVIDIYIYIKGGFNFWYNIAARCGGDPATVFHRSSFSHAWRSIYIDCR